MKPSQALVPVLSLLLASGSVVACSTVLGFEDLSPAGTDAGASSDGGIDVTESGPEADSPDADAAPDVSNDVVDDVPGDGWGDEQDANPDVTDAAEEEAGCGDTTSNPEHCGRCNHDCFDGDCVDGVCQPFKLATVTDGAWGLAIDDKAVYVAVHLNNEIHAYDKVSGGPLMQLGMDPAIAQPPWIAVDSDQNVFWSNRYNTTGSIGMCAGWSCPGGPIEVVENLDRPNGLTTDGESLYWAESNANEVKKSNVDGSNVEVLVPSSENVRPLSVLLHGGYVYFTDLDGGRVGRVPEGGGTIETMGTSSFPWEVAVTDAWVYWTNGETTGGVFRVPNTTPPSGGHAAATVALAQDTPYGIVADSENVYWIVAADWIDAEGALRYCPHAGCPSGQPVSMDENVPYPIDVVADDVALYYSVYGIDGALDGELRKVAKP